MHSLIIFAAVARAEGVPTNAVSSQKNNVVRRPGMSLIFSCMCCMRRANRGFDSRHPCCVPDDDRTTSPEVVRSLGSMLYSHHARFVSSGHILAERDITKLRSAELKAFAKSISRIASPLVEAW